MKNIFSFFKSRKGKINVGGLLGVAATAGLAGMTMMSYVNASPERMENDVLRRMSEIRDGAGSLTFDGIQISTGGLQFASPEEIAAQEGRIFDGGDTAAAAMENFSLQGRNLGQTDGLGMGANAAVELGPDGRPLPGQGRRADGSAIGAAAAAANQTQINKLGAAPQGGLQRATIARASGSNLGSSSGGGTFGPSSSAASSGRRSGSFSGGAGYNFTGAMPTGSSALLASADMSGIRGVSGARFTPGGRDSRIGSGSSSEAGNNLRDIARQSSKVAANAQKSTSSGAGPFLAASKMAGGVQVQDGDTVTLTDGTPAEFEEEMNNRERNLGSSIDDLDNTENEKKEHRQRLWQTMAGLLGATMLGMMTIAALKKSFPWGYAAAIVLALGLLVCIAAFMTDIGKFGVKYGNWGLCSFFFAMGAAMAAGVALAFCSIKFTGWLNGVIEALKSNWAYMTGFSLLSSGLVGQAYSAIPSTFKEAWGKGSGDDSLKND